MAPTMLSALMTGTGMTLVPAMALAKLAPPLAMLMGLPLCRGADQSQPERGTGGCPGRGCWVALRVRLWIGPGC